MRSRFFMTKFNIYVFDLGDYICFRSIVCYEYVLILLIY